jgi:hypothetical protein
MQNWNRYKAATAERDNHLEGYGQSTPARYVLSSAYLDITTDSAKQITLIEGALQEIYAAKLKPGDYDSTRLTSLATLIQKGTKLLVDEKNMMTTLHYVPQYASRVDDAPGTPITPTSLRAHHLDLATVKLPAICYALASLFTTVIQIGGPEHGARLRPQTFQPFQCYSDLADLEDLIIAVKGEYDGGNFANLLGMKLKPVNMKWIYNVSEISYLSSLALFISVYLPAKMNSSGVTTGGFAFNSALGVYFSQAIGLMHVDIGAFLRKPGSADCYWIGIPDPTDGYVSLYEINSGETGMDELVNSSATYDWLHYIASLRSAQTRGFVAGGSPFFQYYTYAGDGATWTTRAQAWLARHVNKRQTNIVSLIPLFKDREYGIPRVQTHKAQPSTYGETGGNEELYRPPTGDGFAPAGDGSGENRRIFFRHFTP